MGHPQDGSETGTNWNNDVAESTTADRGRDRRQDCGEVAWGVEVSIGRHLEAALTHARFVANARAMGADAIGARLRSLKKREQRGEIQRRVGNKTGQRFVGTIDAPSQGVQRPKNLSDKMRGRNMIWYTSGRPRQGGADTNDAPGPPIDGTIN